LINYHKDLTACALLSALFQQ